MKQFIGTIKEIYTEQTYKRKIQKTIEKEVVILKMELGQLVSIQFQGKQRELLKEFKENQEVIIDCVFNGQRTTKRFYDNIIGKKIVKLN